MTKDITLSEFGSGGDMTLLADDLLLTEELLQMAYLSLFGGNVEANTKGNEIDTEQRGDWWANALLYPQASSKQFNSNTERTLNDVVLNTQGRLEIKRAVEKDLEFMSNIAEVTIGVSILTYNRLEIGIKLRRLDNKQEKRYQLIYDNATNAMIINQEI